jgi:hypothetical protein
MSFIKSIILNCPGNYTILGHNVRFFRRPSSSSSNVSSNPLTTLEERVLDTAKSAIKMFFHASFSMPRNISVLVHELCHAETAKWFTGKESTIDFYLSSELFDLSVGGIIHNHLPANSPLWQKNIVSASGCIGSIAFSTAKFAALTMLRNQIPLSLNRLLACEPLYNFGEEIEYAIRSTLKKDSGDFGEIAQTSKMHLAIAGSILAVQSVFGYSVIKKWYHFNGPVAQFASSSRARLSWLPRGSFLKRIHQIIT